MDERASTPPGDGPYRTPPRRPRPRRSAIPWIVGGIIATVAAIAGLLLPTAEERARPALSFVDASLFDDVDAWPAPAAGLPPATPLAPLLVADQPAALAVLAPGEGALRLRRGQALTVAFNRPMVESVAVGRPAERSPLELRPAIPGEARWVSRSRVLFQPALEAWTADVREVQLSFAPGTTATSGEVLVDTLERVIVLDGAPRVISYRSQGRVAAGAPLPLVFDAPVRTSTLAGDLLAYEIGGGQRSLGVRLQPARQQPEDGFRVDVRLARALEPGARIGLALAPRYQPWGGSSPAVLSYELAPRPHVEGVACNEGAAYASQCAHTASPGAIVDIGPTLRLLSSARLAPLSPSAIQIRPPIRDLAVRLAPHGPPQQRLIEIRGEWEADQVYEVRVAGLRTEAGEALRPLPPLAVRSAGHAPDIRVALGARTYEAGADATIPFAAIHAEHADVLYRAVPDGEELRALVAPTPFVREGGVSSPLARLAPDARPNRWGAGRYAWRDEAAGRTSSMAVVAFRADTSSAPGAYRTAFAQSTDIGVTVRASAEGLLLWVTSLSEGGPVAGARVSVADAEASALEEARTDRDGVARVALDASPLVVSHAILVTHGDDRAALLLDPRRAVGPAAMGLTPGERASRDEVATVFTDRGAYRPGEGVHAKVVLRAIEGDDATAITTGRYLMRLFSPSGVARVAEREVRPSAFGTAAADFTLPAVAALGTWRVEVARADDPDTSLGAARLDVAEFRQPTFRVDLGEITGPIHAGESIATSAAATYLFGAPVGRGRARWSLVERGAAPMPERWSRYRFTPVGASAGHGTVASGEGDLDAAGRLAIDAPIQLSGAGRARLALEAEVTDGAGHTHASRRAFVAYPAAIEVGVREGDDWQALGEELALEAIAIDHEGEPVEGRALEARVVREGWHSWWEWSGHAGHEGAYQLRRDREAEVVHRCALTSSTAPVGCRFTPARPGTYRLEVSGADDADRVATASRRVYVAGPDEHPDRDPPGAPIAVTATRSSLLVGETAELAFESPWDGAQALITVEREGVLHVERRAVGAGGQVIRVEVTPEMVPNAFVGVTLVRPRAGPPGDGVDLDAPDLRFGIAELTARPRTTRLNVALEVAARARPGTAVPVTVTVRDERGRPVRGEVALWAVDEGTLRLSGYQVPDTTRDLFRARPPAFAWEDLRRGLVSRLEAPPMPRAGGDGGDVHERARMLDDRERFDPTPLWAPRLVTDADGRVSATIRLPSRPTEYRVMAVAVDTGARAGRASTALVAEQPVVLRPAMPRFAVTGDRFEASVFVHNATDAELNIGVRATIGRARRAVRRVRVPARGEVRVSETITAPAEGPLAVLFEARTGRERVAVRERIPIHARGRFVRSQVFVAGEGHRELAVGLPEGTPPHAGTASVTVASHPFVGFAGAVDALEASRWGGVEAHAATLLALAALDGLEIATAAHGVARDELDARGRRAARALIGDQNADGGFGRWSASSPTAPDETALATHALLAARDRGWIGREEEALTRAVELLTRLVDGAAFGDHYGESGLDRQAYAIRVLADAGVAPAARADALHEQRERLSPYGVAQLAMALGEDDARVDTLVVEATRIVLADREAESADPAVLRWNDRSARVFGAVLEAASRFEVGHARTGALAGELLRARYAGLGLPWGSALETARALAALGAYAEGWRWDEGATPRVRLDGQPLVAAATSRGGARYVLPIRRLVGAHRLRVEGGDEGPVFVTVDGTWAVPLTEHDEVARGRRAALHRVYETADGRPIEDGAAIPLGAMIRVRLFVHHEGGAPPMVGLYDPIPAGFEAVDAGQETTPRAALSALLGIGPGDDAYGPRAHHAMRSLGAIAHRSFSTGATGFYFDQLPSGLSEYTYAIRASTVGTFTAPPAQLDAMHDRDFVARSTTARLRVTAE